MTQLYTKLIFYVVGRNLRKLKVYNHELDLIGLDKLPEGLKQPVGDCRQSVSKALDISEFDKLPAQESWWLLCQFACESLDKDEIVFFQEMI